MLVLNKNDMSKVFTMKDAIQSSKDALRMHSEKKSIVPLRVNINVPKQEGQCLFMPAYVDELDTAGVKIVSVFPKNIALGKPSVPAKMILISGQTGEVNAILDGTHLTRLRTGAMQGMATDILAKKDAKIAALFGTGGQAGTQLEALLNVRDLDEVRVFDINFERAKSFVAEMQKELSHFKTKLIPVFSSDAAIDEANIITTITTSKTPVFDGIRIKPGAHVNAIGGYTPDMQEIPESLVLAANKIIVDTMEGVLAEAGDIIIPMQKGLISKEDIDGDIGQVILGQVKGRESENEITLFKAVGTAVLDVVAANAIYKKALAAKIGSYIDI